MMPRGAGYVKSWKALVRHRLLSHRPLSATGILAASLPHVDAVRFWQSLKNKDILRWSLRQGMAADDSYAIDIAALVRPGGAA